MPLDKNWRTSTRSGTNGQCVEVRQPDGERIQVRDSKDRAGAVLSFGSGEWAAFVASIKNGEFDL